MKYPSHKLKYKFWIEVMSNASNRDDRFPKYQLNRDKCPYLNTSIGNALKKFKIGFDDFEKDKDDEKKIHTIDQRTTTHLSDANDWIILDYIDLLENSNPFGFSTH